MRFREKGKPSLRYVGLFEILEKIGVTTYQLVLPLEFPNVHLVLHVSMLQEYILDPSHVL